MNESSSLEPLSSLISLGILAGLLLYGAYRLGFFKIEPQLKKESYTIKLIDLVIGSAIFLLIPFFVTRQVLVLLNWIHPFGFSPIRFASFAQFFNSLLLIVAFILTLFWHRRAIWRQLFSPKSSWFLVIFIPLLTYVIAFPTISFIDGICEWITYKLFGVTGIDQDAVRFIKGVKSDSAALSMALFTIIIGAPFIEEMLFRGYFQTYLNERLGTAPAIAIASAAFSLFHFSFAQGASNFPLLISLFSFSLFLGFVFARTRTLLCPMLLHLIFNLVTVIRLMSLP